MCQLGNQMFWRVNKTELGKTIDCRQTCTSLNRRMNRESENSKTGIKQWGIKELYGHLRWLIKGRVNKLA